MRLKAMCDIEVSAPQDCPTVAMLRPSSGLAQWLASEAYFFEPHVPSTEYVDSFGNLCQRFVVPQVSATAAAALPPVVTAAPGARRHES